MATLAELRQQAADLGIEVPDGARKPDLEALIAAASAAAHIPATVPADLFAKSPSGSTAGEDAAVVEEIADDLQVPGNKRVLPTSHETEGAAGSYGYAVRAQVADASGLAPQWFTSKVRQWAEEKGGDGRWYVQLERRSTPTKDRRKS